MGLNKMSFETNPVSIEISRSKFDLSHDHNTTFVAGKLVPIYTQDVLPGETYKLGQQCVVRMATPIAPVMDNAFMDVYYFFVPNKLTLSRQMMSPSTSDSNRSWSAIVGAQDSLLNMPIPANGISIPTINFGKGYYNSDSNFSKQSLSDYLGLPDFDGSTAGKRNIEALEVLAYYSVWNNYFRDPNNCNPVTFSISGGSHVAFNGGYYNWSSMDVIGYGEGEGRMGMVFDSVLPVCRLGNYFSSCLPWPQRNSTAVTLPIGDIAPLKVVDDPSASASNIENAKIRVLGGWSGAHNLALDFASGSSVGEVASLDSASAGDPAGRVLGTNIVADLRSATATSIDLIRYAFAMQRWYEQLARGGNSLGDLTKTMFGVTPSWAHSDRPEFLGAKRIPIQVEQVNATASSSVDDKKTSLGTTGAYSLTYSGDQIFTKSFDTWGTIIGVACVRTDESFHQGLERRFSRTDKFSLYWRQFAHIGEQPVLNKEIRMTGTDLDEKVFGYQEAWAEYRFRNNYKTGFCRPGQSQAYWSYTNDFEGTPTLKGYIDASAVKDNVDRTLQVPSTVSGFQFMAQFHFDVQAVRPMPVNSIPGLVDHN